ncbi:MAG: ShlB/FhaC/HecB family hemolysin secretion/activation protein [Nostoc sp. DedSLP03]|uniref:ShlB/FhaC/HecB family hemolysin secretion/activation protein n=1 Tax=Nostoc sp. DedSLP03 TaxID=3075400 RepID=UPI002AD4D080|nr:ShlB/FhaC/HecB family hemolysin secretion/activation protein [Nostoc sp. DedSLP03]MDZ7969127.1 ShlB/FhaC/HecB family hemolysin secretion/activation protein [Nostoc sp. DedSLP03]
MLSNIIAEPSKAQVLNSAQSSHFADPTLTVTKIPFLNDIPPLNAQLMSPEHFSGAHIVPPSPVFPKNLSRSLYITSTTNSQLDSCPSLKTNSSEFSTNFPDDIPATIYIDKFELENDSSIFSKDELLKEINNCFTHRSLSFTELLNVTSIIIQKYLDADYNTSGAYIAPQEIVNGVVKIKLLEGEVEDILVTGAPRLNNYVRNRLARATTKPLKQKRLEEALQLLQLDPLIKSVSAELSAGSRPGTNLLQVKVTANDSFKSQLFIDNNRSPNIGTFRRQVQFNETNLLGLGDSISLAYGNTDGSNIIDANYTLPINSSGSTLSFSYGNTSSNVIERPFNQLDINANSRYYELTFRQPIIQTPRQELVLGLTASHRQSQASLLGGKIPFPVSGADEEGRTQVSALRFFQEWTNRKDQEVIAIRSQFSFGLGLLNATINENPPDSRFFNWRLQGQWIRLLAPDTLLLVRSDMQFANQALLSPEQFELGGQDSVRGYRQDFRLTDSGISTSVEARLPIARFPQVNGVLQVAPFVDFGVGLNQSNERNANSNILASVGLGLRLRMGDHLNAHFDWGIPLVSTNSEKRTWQENGLYFGVEWNPFSF